METAVRENAPMSARTPRLMQASIVLFALGMLAVVVVFVLFAIGLTDLPVWLSAFAGVVTPLGLGLGLVSLVREHRRR